MVMQNGYGTVKKQNFLRYLLFLSVLTIIQSPRFYKWQILNYRK